MKKVSSKRTRELLDKFKQAKILVLGDLMVDKYIWGKGIRLSSEAPVPVIKVSREDYSLGGAANIAYYLAGLGAHTYLCGLVGYDDAAYNLRSIVVKVGIDAGGVFPTSNRPTTRKIRIMSSDHSQVLGRFDFEEESPVTLEESAPMLQFLKSYIDDIDILILSDYNKGIFKSEKFLSDLRALQNKKQVYTVAQCRSEKIEKFDWVNHLILSIRSARAVIGNGSEEDSLNAVTDKLRHRTPVTYITIYDPAQKSMITYHGGKKICICSELPTQAWDQTGLGDVTTALTALAKAAGATEQESLELAFRGIDAAGKQTGTGKINFDHLMNQGVG